MRLAWRLGGVGVALLAFHEGEGDKRDSDADESGDNEDGDRDARPVVVQTNVRQSHAG
jgi:hypothetical protein